MSKRSGEKPSFFGILIAFIALLGLNSPALGEEMDWQRTSARLRDNPDPVARKLILWLSVTERAESADTKELISFALENFNWPKLYVFRQSIEQNIDTLPRAEIAAWFDQNPPKSAEGLKSYISALISLGHADKAKAALKKFWLNAELSKKETSALAQQYQKLFSLTDHTGRLDNLLWEQRYQEAENMLPLVNDAHNKLAQARIALGRLSSKAPKKIQAVPSDLQNNSGLLYDRLKWRRQMNKDKDAFELLQHAPKNPARPELWWRERNILARRLLEKGDYDRAYKITSGHGLTSGVDYSQAEWLLGWLALEFLNQPDKAYKHFENFYQAVTSAVSRSRGAYWLARAADKLQQKESARNWHLLAAQFPSTFYGQLSHEKVFGPILSPAQFLDDQVPPETLQNFSNNEMVKTIRLLTALRLLKYTDPFFIKLLDKAKDRPDFVLIAKLARETDRLYFSVEANKQLQQKLGDFMFTEGYPLLPSLPTNKPESALIHAIVHRESMFDTRAESPAGARGLMQLMPATAKHVSKRKGKKYTVSKLMDNPEYNIELGAAYLQSMLDNYDGFYPLAIAAYNAGPGNVSEWIREFGDPRKSKVDLIDWIEQIPIYETRNYIQRVMESYYIYKLRLSEQPKTVLAFQ